MISCFRASCTAMRILVFAISSITVSSTFLRAASISLITSSGVPSCCNLLASTCNLKKGELGGRRASKSFDAKLLTPLAPIP